MHFIEPGAESRFAVSPSCLFSVFGRSQSQSVCIKGVFEHQFSVLVTKSLLDLDLIFNWVILVSSIRTDVKCSVILLFYRVIV